MRKLIATSVVAGIVALGSVACSSTQGHPAKSTPMNTTTQPTQGIAQWAQTTGFPVLDALWNEIKGDNCQMAVHDGSLAVQDDSSPAPYADVQDAYTTALEDTLSVAYDCVNAGQIVYNQRYATADRDFGSFRLTLMNHGLQLG